MEIAVLLLFSMIVVTVISLRLGESSPNYPFKKRAALFSPAERHFMLMLEKACEGEFRVYCRLKLSDLVALHPGIDPKSARTAFNKASKKQVDFVLCQKDDLTPILAIDLLGAHKDDKANNKDLFICNALESVGIPLARIKFKPDYKLDEIRDCIETKLVPLRKRQGLVVTPKIDKKLKPVTDRPTRPMKSSRRPVTQAAAA